MTSQKSKKSKQSSISKKRISPRRKTTAKFIEEAKSIHKEKYSYDETVYTTAKIKVKIRCRTHGPFMQNPWDHLRGNGCPKCGIDSIKRKQRKPPEQFIQEAKEVHGQRYSYKKTVYINNKTPVSIDCKTHGTFQNLPETHLNGSGCPKCGIEKNRNKRLKTTDYFIKRAKKVHGDRYCYDESVYIHSDTHVKIICRTHGAFMQNPIHHAAGQGCPKCGKISMADHYRKPADQFIFDY